MIQGKKTIVGCGAIAFAGVLAMGVPYCPVLGWNHVVGLALMGLSLALFGIYNRFRHAFYAGNEIQRCKIKKVKLT